MTVPHPTPETSSSPPPLPSTPGPAAVPPQHNPDPQTPSGAPNIPSSASTNPVPNNILPTGPPLSSNSPMTRFDLSPSRPEPHRSIMITTAPSAPPGPTSALDLGTAAEGDSSSMPGLRKEKDIADPPSLNRVIPANTRATLNLPPQSLSLPLVSDPDATTAGLSPREREPYAKHTGDHPRHPSLCSYDMV
ncbi:hypothetical protein EDB84DRAFT_1514283 [Lactarius hengduanensis]|nr:hypothetical protein EDB84DRAFT_1514283 [Lactarius hengduanensis]